ncbi:MAG: sulfur carrier protein ThiS [Sulfurospirillum sp.]|nr:sulfur carrier protein ThiS [Sulfurospirillum sp.]
MKVLINGETKEFQDNINLLELLKVEDVAQPDMVSVQLNDTFVTKDDYSSIVLKEGDTINFLYFMGGGA